MTSEIEARVASLGLQDTLEQSIEPAPTSPPRPSPFLIPELLSDVFEHCKMSEYSLNKAIFYRLSLVNRIFYDKALPFLYSNLELLFFSRAFRDNAESVEKKEQLERATFLHRTLREAVPLARLVKSARITVTKLDDDGGWKLVLALNSLSCLEKLCLKGPGGESWPNIRGGGGSRRRKQVDWVTHFAVALAKYQHESLSVLIVPQLRLSSTSALRILQHCSKLKVFKANFDSGQPSSLCNVSAAHLERLASDRSAPSTLSPLLGSSKGSLRILSFAINFGDTPLFVDQLHNLESLVIEAQPPEASSLLEFYASLRSPGRAEEQLSTILEQVETTISSARHLRNLRHLALVTTIDERNMGRHFGNPFEFLPESLVHFVLGPMAYPHLPWSALYYERFLNPNIKKISIPYVPSHFASRKSNSEKAYFGVWTTELIKEVCGVDIEWMDTSDVAEWREEQFGVEGMGKDWKF